MLSFLPLFQYYETLRVNACNVSLDLCTFHTDSITTKEQWRTGLQMNVMSNVSPSALVTLLNLTLHMKSHAKTVMLFKICK